MNKEVTAKELIFLSTGRPVFHRQTIYSVLSVLKHDKGDDRAGIVIYTDNPGYFEKYFDGLDRIKYVHLSAEELKDWSGPYHYVFRLKIKAIQHSLGVSGKKILYVDSDVIFRQDPNILFELINEETALMYKQEGLLTNPKQKNWEVIRRQLPGTIMTMDDESFTIPITTYMWNAGVVGLPAGSMPLVEKWLDLTDQYCSYSTFPGLHQDQLVISFLLAKYKKLLPATGVIHHYCYGNEKANVNLLLKKYFSGKVKPVAEMMDEFDSVIPFPIPNDPVKDNLVISAYKFLRLRKTGLRLAIERVKKTGRPLTFFERGKKY